MNNLKFTGFKSPPVSPDPNFDLNMLSKEFDVEEVMFRAGLNSG